PLVRRCLRHSFSSAVLSVRCDTTRRPLHPTPPGSRCSQGCTAAIRQQRRVTLPMDPENQQEERARTLSALTPSGAATRPSAPSAPSAASATSTRPTPGDRTRAGSSGGYTGVLVIHGIGNERRNQTLQEAANALTYWFNHHAGLELRATGPGRVWLETAL